MSVGAITAAQILVRIKLDLLPADFTMPLSVSQYLLGFLNRTPGWASYFRPLSAKMLTIIVIAQIL
jgi:hypothetical protein